MEKGPKIVHNEGRFRGYDGIDLFYQWWSPKNSKASLVIVHGIGEHSSRYSHVGNHFSKLGYSVYAYDQRGNGRSAGRRGHIKDFNEYILDLNCFIEYLSLKGKPFILGHSLGGLVSIRFAMDYPEGIAGLIVSSPALGLSMDVPIWKKVAAYSLRLAYPVYTFIDNGIPAKYLSHDPKICDAYDRDPLVHRQRSARFFVEFIKASQKTSTQPQRLKIPALFLQAGDDRIVSVDALVRFYTRVSVKNKALKIYPYFYHEILNETQKDKVFKDIEEWLGSLTPGQGV